MTSTTTTLLVESLRARVFTLVKGQSESTKLSRVQAGNEYNFLLHQDWEQSEAREALALGAKSKKVPRIPVININHILIKFLN